MLLDTLTPFLYPCFFREAIPTLQRVSRIRRHIGRRETSTTSTYNPTSQSIEPPSSLLLSDTEEQPLAEHLNPPPDQYSLTPFTDKCTVTLQAGNGGHGCVSFLREKFIAEGPANGGDGGSGGGIYIQAVRGETSLHKLARQGMIKAGRGKNGQGKSQGGERGEDAVFTVPVGTVVREVYRLDPVAEEKELARLARREAWRRGEDFDSVHNEYLSKDKWIIYPGTMLPEDIAVGEGPAPRIRRTSSLAALQPEGPIRLDIDAPMERPMLLAAGAVGGLGNPHFVSRTVYRPKYATKGENGMKLVLELELKVLADVGLVGLPNAGKSTLLRALTKSRTRVGSWAFTTLQPSIGTVVLDDHKGRPSLRAFEKTGEARSSFTIADIPGLIEDAHLDKGLGLGFLRHVERAAVLAFVVDLSARDAIEAVKALWKEVGEYETMRNKEINAETESRMAFERLETRDGVNTTMPPPPPAPISSKPWFVVATKADLPDTQANFLALQKWVEELKGGGAEHPSGKKNAWKTGVRAVPVSAINAEGVQVIPKLVVDLLGWAS